jgi:hypothetical protein
VLDPLYPLLRHDAMTQPTPEMQTIVRLLAKFESILIEEGVLTSDFVLCVCWKKQRVCGSRAGRGPGGTALDPTPHHRYASSTDTDTDRVVLRDRASR